jgi:hypothetical protein
MKVSRSVLLRSVVLILFLAACSDGDSGSGDTGPVSEVCAVLESEPAGQLGEVAIDKLAHELTDGRYEGGIAGSLLIEIVQQNCEYLLRHAVLAIQGFFGGAPKQANLPDLHEYAGLDLEASLIASQLSIGTQDLDSLVSFVCADLRGTRESNPVADLQSFAPNADLSQIRAVNAVAARVVRTCGFADPRLADSLDSEFLTYLISNEFPDDTPPIITSFTWTRADYKSIDLHWTLLDPLDAKSYQLWVLSSGRWIELSDVSGSPYSVANVYSDRSYWFALRAVDAQGNASPWIYLQPCLTCG